MAVAGTTNSLSCEKGRSRPNLHTFARENLLVNHPSCLDADVGAFAKGCFFPRRSVAPVTTAGTCVLPGPRRPRNVGLGTAADRTLRHWWAPPAAFPPGDGGTTMSRVRPPRPAGPHEHGDPGNCSLDPPLDHEHQRHGQQSVPEHGERGCGQQTPASWSTSDSR